ncbi:hypothetical protein B4114_2305 [Geobacillus stearothermophilus]|uniref:Uncharacterized protein n=1 Tax=Geobacillus stearothermophilus TaxID=1422 RepID=A0A150NBZ1_GEOSE|nr:hypothetical protein B4114_2305 [Geobacillus stearothermophilus]
MFPSFYPFSHYNQTAAGMHSLSCKKRERRMFEHFVTMFS